MANGTVNGIVTGFDTRDRTARVDVGAGVTVEAVPPTRVASEVTDRWLSITIRDNDARYETRAELSMADAAELVKTLTAYLAIDAKPERGGGTAEDWDHPSHVGPHR